MINKVMELKTHTGIMKMAHTTKDTPQSYESNFGDQIGCCGISGQSDEGASKMVIKTDQGWAFYPLNTKCRSPYFGIKKE